MNRRKEFLVVLSAIAALGFGRQATAGPIIGPVSATTNMGEAFPLADSYNQSGLSATYVSGVTDFDTFTATTTHDSEPGNDWVSSGLPAGGNATYDLGGLVSVDQLALWNFGGLGGVTSFGITQFTLVASTDAGFSSPITLGTFNPTVYATLNPAQVFSFAPTTAEFFRLQDFSSNGASAIGLGEVAFDAVPEPTSLLLLGTGLIGVVRAVRKRRTLA